MSIGTGDATGVYYPAGGAICRLMNKTREQHGIGCSVRSTEGSVYNINTVRAGELEFGVAQSDWQFHAYNGTSKFDVAGRFEKLRAVFSVHPEPFTMIGRAGSGIRSFADIRGRRVNVGNPGSGQRATMEVVMKAANIAMSDLALAAELNGSEMAQALCGGVIDVMMYTVGHPAAAVTEAATTCDIEMIPVEGPAIDKLVADHPFYRKTVVPGGLYRGNPGDTPTFGVGATFITSADVPEDIVYTLVKTVFDNFDDFKSVHPAFAHLKEEDMARDDLSAPLHRGAAKYYRERGW